MGEVLELRGERVDGVRVDALQGGCIQACWRGERDIDVSVGAEGESWFVGGGGGGCRCDGGAEEGPFGHSF